MMNRTGVLGVVASLVLAACAVEDDTYPDEQEDVSSLEQELAGPPVRDIQPGIVRIFASAADWRGSQRYHTGMLVVLPGKEEYRDESDLVLASSYLLPPSATGWRRPAIRVQHGLVSARATSNEIRQRMVVDVVRHPVLPVVLLRLDRPIAVRGLPRLSPELPDVKADLTCFGYTASGTLLRMVKGSVEDEGGLGYYFRPTTGYSLHDSDYGVPCTDDSYRTLHGLSLFNDQTGLNEQIAVGQLRDWVWHFAQLSRR